MTQETDKALVRKFIAGNCTPEEQERVQALLSQPGSENIFNELLDEDWKGFRKEEEVSDEWILDFRQRLVERSNQRPARKLKVTGLKFFRYAAVWGGLILCIAAMYTMWRFYRNPGPEQEIMLTASAPYGHRSRIILADSTIVTLGSGSTLRYPQSFNGNARKIHLTGEAFFSVTKDPARPFIVYSGDLQTEVLGTSFKISAFGGQPVVVAVATGKVQVGRRDTGSPAAPPPLAVLSPGDEITWHPASGRATLNRVAEGDVSGWEKGQLAFTGIPLKDVAAVLERWYNVRITINDKNKAGYRMSFVLDGTKPISRSLEMLKATIKADYRITGDTIIIQ